MSDEPRAAGTAQAGWYADPLRRFELRFHNGSTWTADVSDGGERFVDPAGLTPTPYGSPLGSGHGPVVTTSTNGAATTAMTFGIIAVAISWLPFVVVLGALAAIVALVLGWVGLQRSKVSGVGRSRAIAGLATGGGGLVACALGVALTIVVLQVYDDYINPAPHEVVVSGCSTAGSRATATGTVTNLGDDPADFSIVIGFVRPGTDNPDRTARTTVDGVGPGATADFQVERQVRLDEVDCNVVEVTGPLPFGLTLD